MPRLRPLLACLCALLVSGCKGEEGGGTASDDGTQDGSTDSAGGAFVSLLDHDSWTVVEAVADPLGDHRPAMVVCGIAGWYVESGESLEIDTNYCNYLALRQPILAPVTLGAAMELDFYHFDLTALEAAEAHFAVLIDGQILWETNIEIPGKAMYYSESFAAPFEAPAGAELIVHLHNHGQNTWQLQDLRVWVAD